MLLAVGRTAGAGAAAIVVGVESTRTRELCGGYCFYYERVLTFGKDTFIKYVQEVSAGSGPTGGESNNNKQL